MKLLRITCFLLVLLLSLVAFAFVAVHPAWAKVPGPNGRIAFDREDPATGDMAVFTANPDGTDEVQLLLPPPAGFLPRWAPDGTKILFARNPAPRQGGQEDLYTINPDGTGLTQVTNTPDFEDFPDWGPFQG
jgi:Tol biopolymer transport system component